jgi:hypothetical protein
VQSDIQDLILLASRGLVHMFDEQKQLFCYRIVRGKHGLRREKLSPRYTIMTLLGLCELERSGGQSSFDIRAIYESFVLSVDWIRSAGDLGLLLWLTAAFDPHQLEGLIGRIDLGVALRHYPDTRAGRTMELSWFLAGLAHAAEASPKLGKTLTDLAVETYRCLKENQGKHNLFGHMNIKKSLKGRLRGRIGSFADQIYPIYALSKSAKAFHMEDALPPALECAKAICRAQGKLGQWWWLYDSLSGKVSIRYPVYSVHQHGMAPMGLFAVEEATGLSFQEPLYKGLRWIYGDNELRADMRDRPNSIIWRCILPKSRVSKYSDTFLSILRSPEENAPVRQLEILFEDRPYELGWLLFAFTRNSARQIEVCSTRTPQ